MPSLHSENIYLIFGGAASVLYYVYYIYIVQRHQTHLEGSFFMSLWFKINLLLLDIALDKKLNTIEFILY